MKLRLLSSADVRAALPMPKAIEAMRRAFGQLSAGQAEMPLRGRLATEKGVTLLMPAYLKQSRELGIKIVSVYGDNPALGLPIVTACVIALDPQTGLPQALIEGSMLTAIRTGAGGGLAAELLASAQARTVALFGAGVQARVQLEAVMAVRSITRVNLLSRTRASAEKLAAEIAAWPVARAPAVNIVATPKETVRDADIVITATTSPTPVFDGHDLKPGAHITGVGSYTLDTREVDETAVRRAGYIVVDSYTMARAEAGDLMLPSATMHAELGEIVNGVKPGRTSDDQITFFKSVGVAAQDAAAASAVLAEAEAQGLGTVVEL